MWISNPRPEHQRNAAWPDQEKRERENSRSSIAEWTSRPRPEHRRDKTCSMARLTNVSETSQRVDLDFHPRPEHPTHAAWPEPKENHNIGVMTYHGRHRNVGVTSTRNIVHQSDDHEIETLYIMSDYDRHHENQQTYHTDYIHVDSKEEKKNNSTRMRPESDLHRVESDIGRLPYLQRRRRRQQQ